MTGLKRLLVTAAGGEKLTEKTATGNPATFTTTVAKAIKGMTIPIIATQSGSGTPSPSNVRPIIGQNGLIVYHSGEDTSNPETITVFSGWTMYGGEINLLTGAITITHVYGTLTPFGKPDGVNWFYTTATSLSLPDIETTNAGLMCDRFQVAGNTGDHSTDPNITFYSSNIIRWIEPDCISMTLAEYKQYLTDNPDKVPHICYKIKTPITGTVDPKSITTLVGENNIWTNTSGTNTVKYLTKA